MRAVYAQSLFAGNLVQDGTGRQCHFVNDFVLPVQAAVVQRSGHLRGNIHNQRAAQRNVQNLLSAANGQQRLALAENFPNQP